MALNQLADWNPKTKRSVTRANSACQLACSPSACHSSCAPGCGTSDKFPRRFKIKKGDAK